MTAGRAAASCRCFLKTGGNAPVAKSGPLFADQFIQVAGMGLMTGPATAPLPGIGDVDVMEIVFAVAKVGIDGGLGESQHVAVVAIHAQGVGIRLERRVETCRIGVFQQAEIIGAVGIVTGGAGPFGHGPMQHRFALEFTRHVFKGPGAPIVILAMTGETNLLLRGGKQGRVIGKMRGMTDTATFLPIKRRVPGR